MSLTASPINKVFFMFKRMTNWAENYQIVKRMIVSISILMMNAKNFRMFFISTFLAFFKESPAFKVSFYTIPFVYFKNCISKVFNSTIIRTILPFILLPFIYCKFFSTFYASKRFRTKPISCIISTFLRTIFFYVKRGFKLKGFFANITNKIFFYCSIYQISFCRTFVRTIFCFIFSILLNIKFIITYFTSFINSLFIKRHPFSVFTITFPSAKSFISLTCQSYHESFFTNFAYFWGNKMPNVFMIALPTAIDVYFVATFKDFITNRTSFFHNLIIKQILSNVNGVEYA